MRIFGLKASRSFIFFKGCGRLYLQTQLAVQEICRLFRKFNVSPWFHGSFVKSFGFVDVVLSFNQFADKVTLYFYRLELDLVSRTMFKIYAINRSDIYTNSNKGIPHKKPLYHGAIRPGPLIGKTPRPSINFEFTVI